MAPHAGSLFLQFKIAVPVRKVLCARYRFFIKRRISGPAQKNNRKPSCSQSTRAGLNLTTVTVTDFAMWRASASCWRRRLTLLVLAAMAPMMTDRPSGLEIEPGYGGNDIEPGLALDAHRLKRE